MNATDRSARDWPDDCLPVRDHEDVNPAYRGTAIELLLTYHNLGGEFRQHSTPELIIATCMDYRIGLRMPNDFAYVLRAGGANLRGLEFHVSAAVAQGVTSFALIGHDQCAMCGVSSRRQPFVDGLVEHGGWNRRDAERHFDTWSAQSEIGDVLSFVRWEALRLSRRYPGVLIAPLLYSVTERVLYQVEEGE